MSRRDWWVLLLIAAVAVTGYAIGYRSGSLDTLVRVGLEEDGSYRAGCLPGWPCDDTVGGGR